jgi:hypothetical protein
MDLTPMAVEEGLVLDRELSRRWAAGWDGVG